MTPSNIERLAQAFAGWGRDEPANMADILHRDCELVVPDSIPYGGTFHGPDAVIGWFTRDLWRWFDEFKSTPEGFVDGGDQIVVPVHVEAQTKSGRRWTCTTSGSTSSAKASSSADACMRTPRCCATP